MKLTLKQSYPNKAMAAFEGNFPGQNREILKHLATKDHPVRLSVLGHLAARCSGLELTCPLGVSEPVFEIECRPGTTVGEAAWVFYESLGALANSLRRHPKFGPFRIHDLELVVDLPPTDRVIFWLGSVERADRPIIREYLERLDAR